MGGTTEARLPSQARGRFLLYRSLRVSESRSHGFASSYRDLNVYQQAIESAMAVFELTKTFPAEERYSLTDQIRRSSRSVCANLAEAWRKRRYRQAFIAKLSDAEAEAAETQVWIELSVRCGYLRKERAEELAAAYEGILAQVVKMIAGADSWTVKPRPQTTPIRRHSDTPLPKENSGG